MPVCDVCNQELRWKDGYVLSTTQVTTTEAYWHYLFTNQWNFYLSDAEDASFLLGLVQNQAGQATGWLVCEDCSRLFSFDRDEAKRYARKKSSQPPGAGPADMSRSFAAARSAVNRLLAQRSAPPEPEPTQAPAPPADDRIRFACPCGTKLAVESSLAGKKGRCPKCRQVIDVPGENLRTSPFVLAHPEKDEDAQSTPAAQVDTGKASREQPKKEGNERIEVVCPNCGVSMLAPVGYLGKKVRHDKCGHSFVLKSPAEAAQDKDADSSLAEIDEEESPTEQRERAEQERRKQEVPMKCDICGKTATLARVSGHLICQSCNRQLEADIAARFFGGKVPAVMQRAWDKSWKESVVPETRVNP